MQRGPGHDHCDATGNPPTFLSGNVAPAGRRLVHLSTRDTWTIRACLSRSTECGSVVLNFILMVESRACPHTPFTGPDRITRSSESRVIRNPFAAQAFPGGNERRSKSCNLTCADLARLGTPTAKPCATTVSVYLARALPMPGMRRTARSTATASTAIAGSRQIQGEQEHASKPPGCDSAPFCRNYCSP